MLPPSEGLGYPDRVTKPPFRVIDGTPAPDTPRERQRARVRKTVVKTPFLIRCHRCTGNTMIEGKTALESMNGKPRGGQKALICAHCLSRGEFVIVTP